MEEQCIVCGNRQLDLIYDGEIRSAGVNSEFITGYQILECKSCKVNFLSPFPDNINEFYESDEYRQHYDHTIDENELATKYDYEQNDRIYNIGIQDLRGKWVGDFGCGVGLFLDVIKGIAKKTVAVEPMKSCAEILREKGHTYFERPHELKQESLDVAVSFDTLEHIDNQLVFLKSIFNSLKKGGYLYLSIPNRNDLLMNVHKEVFRKFFYCKAHLFYHDINSLSYVIKKSGFSIIARSGLHKYDFHNFISWLKMDKPCGRKKNDAVDAYFESQFKNELMRLNMSSHLFVKAQKQ